MQRYLFWVDSISMWLGKAFAWFVILLVLVVSYDVIATKFFSASVGWAYDFSIILYGTLFMMGGAYALARNAHVRGDIFYRRWPVRWQARVDLLLYVVFFFPGMLALVSVGAQWAALSWQINELSSQSARQIPIYPFKTVIPVAAFFLTLQGVAETVRCIQALRTGIWPPRLGDVEELETLLVQEGQAKVVVEEGKV